MAESLYNVAITKHTSDKPVETLVQEALELLDRAGDPYMEYKLSEALLFGQSGAVLENLPLTESERIQQKLLNMGIETLLQLATDARSKTENTSAADSQSEEGPVDIVAQPDNTPAQNGLQRHRLQRPGFILAGVATLSVLAVGYFAMGMLNKPQPTVPSVPEGLTVAQSALGVKGKTGPYPQQTAGVASTAVRQVSKPLTTSPAADKTANRQSATPGNSMIPVATSAMSATDLEELKQILKAVGQQALADTKNGNEQYNRYLKKLNRLLELDKPDLALVFAETVADPYEAALLVLNVARSEQQHQRDTYRDEIILTIKGLASREKKKLSLPLMKATLSQAYVINGDSVTADNLLQQALQQLNNGSDTAKQISCLRKMITSHQHSDTDTTKKLTHQPGCHVRQDSR
ncbi:MAG: hypothetical protein CSA79_01875 [Thiothrix nivea]|nr:MAG: hypothetical protein CSA79_01875 [Thiothrix nivea]